jgi:hypothetical protein
MENGLSPAAGTQTARVWDTESGNPVYTPDASEAIGTTSLNGKDGAAVAWQVLPPPAAEPTEDLLASPLQGRQVCASHYRDSATCLRW